MLSYTQTTLNDVAFTMLGRVKKARELSVNIRDLPSKLNLIKAKGANKVVGVESHQIYCI